VGVSRKSGVLNLERSTQILELAGGGMESLLTMNEENFLCSLGSRVVHIVGGSLISGEWIPVLLRDPGDSPKNRSRGGENPSFFLMKRTCAPWGRPRDE